MLLQDLAEKGLAHPPKWLASNTQYLCVMGSTAYGVTSSNSDLDVYGWAIPRKGVLFPHLEGHVLGLHFADDQPETFEQYMEHHIKDPSACKGAGQEYDFAVYSIVKYFQLALVENNPNMVDSLFVPDNCVIHSTAGAQMLRDRRRQFLHKGCWHTFKGYAYSQLKKAFSQQRTGKRVEIIEEFGYDVKFAYHIVRLMGEVEQILAEGDLDLQRNREQLKSVRRGEWSEEQIRGYFADKEKQLEELYLRSPLPPGPDSRPIKGLLFEILEHHYGSLQNAVVHVGEERRLLQSIAAMVSRYL